MCFVGVRDFDYGNRVNTMGFMMHVIGLSLCVSLVVFFYRIMM